MMRTTDGKLAILDFGLMTEVTENQKYGMIEAIVHLLNRDYSEIGQDFINLDFIPEGTNTEPIVPALTKGKIHCVLYYLPLPIDFLEVFCQLDVFLSQFSKTIKT